MITDSVTSQAASRVNPFVASTNVVLAITACGGPAAALRDLHVSILIATLAWGWSEIDGACGMSHLGAITCLKHYATIEPDYKIWRRSIAAYTLGGCITGAAVGAVLAFAGARLGIQDAGQTFWPFALVIGMALTAREFRILSFKLPQINLQTQPVWFRLFGPVVAAAMWGMHIGIGMATVVRHGGFWFLVTLIVGFADPTFGASLMATYWIGRTLPIWVAPVIARHGDPNVLSDEVSDRGGYRRLAAVTLAWTVLVVAINAMAGTWSR
jgi:hypothetical protein